MPPPPRPQIFLHDHPVSSYAQKIRIALREKHLPFNFATPAGLGSGKDAPALRAANPRMEVPALEDGDLKLFDSSVILQYLEEAYPETPLLPPLGTKDAAAVRAKARMIEEVCDSVYEAANWGVGEVRWMSRAEGQAADALVGEARRQIQVILNWLAEQLGTRDYFNGDTFGYADVCAAPVLNRSVFNGMGPAEGSPLQLWHVRIQKRESVQSTFAEMAAAAGGMVKMAEAFKPGKGMRREYRDYRLEWMVKSGGMDVVLRGLKEDTIRFGWPAGAKL